jgi:hypothetical protein
LTTSKDLQSPTLSGPTNPKPKQKQTSLTASAVQQRRIDDLNAKRHKSDVHKAAMRLYASESQKSGGMSIQRVVDVITARFETCPSKVPAARESNIKVRPDNNDD